VTGPMEGSKLGRFDGSVLEGFPTQEEDPKEGESKRETARPGESGCFRRGSSTSDRKRQQETNRNREKGGPLVSYGVL